MNINDTNPSQFYQSFDKVPHKAHAKAETPLADDPATFEDALSHETKPARRIDPGMAIKTAVDGFAKMEQLLKMRNIGMPKFLPPNPPAPDNSMPAMPRCGTPGPTPLPITNPPVSNMPVEPYPKPMPLPTPKPTGDGHCPDDSNLIPLPVVLPDPKPQITASPEEAVGERIGPKKLSDLLPEPQITARPEEAVGERIGPKKISDYLPEPQITARPEEAIGEQIGPKKLSDLLP